MTAVTVTNPLSGPVVDLGADSVIQLLREQVSRTPDAVAIEYEGRSIDYLSFWQRGHALAAALRAEGVRPGDRVAVWAHRTPDVPAAMLAAMLVRAPYVPLDPSYPAGRITQILQTARPAVLVGEGPIPSAVSGFDIAYLDTAAVGSDRAGDVFTDPRPQDPAYVMFTSGSSGAPKGVVVSHLALLNYTRWSADTFCGAGGGSPLFASLGFDHSITCLWPILISGGSVVLIPGIWDLSGVFAERPQPFSFVKATPSHLKFFEKLYRPDYTSLTTTLMFGGEALDIGFVRTVADRLAGVRLINHYGPTEATVGCLYHEFDAGRTDPDGGVPIGRPVWNMRAYVVDGDLRPVEPGTAGELVVAGFGVAQGYLGSEESAAFLDESLLGGPPGPAYRTGDLVELLPEGALSYRGRLDDQLKINGYRIEPAEIRRHLLAVDGVADVVVRIAGTAEPTLEIHVAPADSAVNTAELPRTARAALRHVLPAAVVPKTVHLVAEIGVNAHGKQDLTATGRVTG